MAYTEIESNPIPEGAAYYSGKMPLGDYNFYLQYDAATAKVTTRCDMPDGIRGATSRQLPAGAQIQQWRIEANETEASVYAKVFSEGVDLPTTQLSYFEDWWVSRGIIRATNEISNTVIFSSSSHRAVLASASPFSNHYTYKNLVYGEGTEYAYAYTKSGKTVYYLSNSYTNDVDVLPNTGAVFPDLPSSDIAWSMVYNRPIDEEILVARFAINIGDAGGYPGGDGGWTSPGDWNSDPTTTLHLTVSGALSGRHNDPLTDLSYSYVPADNTAKAGYGCGGDGGHGGGGGGGASTVIVRQFATNKANYKDILALAKRHGYGSGGGKGGKGGDGCILIYY